MQMIIVIIININMVNGDVIMINDHKHDNNYDNMKIIKITIKEITTTMRIIPIMKMIMIMIY